MSDLVSTNSLLNLDPDSFVDLFEIYVDNNLGVVRFHSGKNFNNYLVYRGNQYVAMPIEYSGFEFSADGKQNRPTFKIANIDGFITDYIKNKNDLINSKMKRIKIFVRNLDDVNFSANVNPFFGYRAKRNATKGYGESFYEETYIVNRKRQENKYFIEFDLSSPIDVENQTIPNRKISDNLCSWNYRGCGCNYGKIPWPEGQTIKVNNQTITENNAQLWNGKVNQGVPVADENNVAFYSNSGYGLTQITFRQYNPLTGQYNPGDFIKYIDSINYDFFGDKVQKTDDNISYSFYVCIKVHGASLPAGAKNPTTEKEYWVKDSCSKDLTGCKLRWNNHPKGLPYGGFPGTRPFDYSV
jgi:lambda family phage minor tail protein L